MASFFHSVNAQFSCDKQCHEMWRGGVVHLSKELWRVRLASQGTCPNVWAGVLVLYPSVLEYGTKRLHVPAGVTGTAPFQTTTLLRLQ